MPVPVDPLRPPPAAAGLSTSLAPRPMQRGRPCPRHGPHDQYARDPAGRWHCLKCLRAALPPSFPPPAAAA